MASIFTKIINREIPAYIVAESDTCIAFLDIFPLAEGHTLVVPKVETDLIFDLTPAQLSELTLFAQKVAKAIQKVFPYKRPAIAVIGLEVPHAHIHIVPINFASELSFSNEKLKLSQERLAEIAESIHKEYSNLT